MRNSVALFILIYRTVASKQCLLAEVFFYKIDSFVCIELCFNNAFYLVKDISVFMPHCL